MIFLAVSMGFIAENIREHITDRKKEKQYISSFIRNLKDDTSFLFSVIEFDRRQVKGIDSILRLSHANMTMDSNRNSFYHLALQYLYSTALFRGNDATLQQLKSTGDYRLIEKDHVADSLSKYDADVRGIYTQGAYCDTYFREVISGLDEVIDLSIFKDSAFANITTAGLGTNKPTPMLRNEKEKLPTLFNKIIGYSRITGFYADAFLAPQLENAKNLIAYLKSAYDINE